MFAKRRHRHHRLRVVPCNHPKFRWTIAGHYASGKRVRKYFLTRGEAQTYASQLDVMTQNLGTKATQIDQRLHVMAVRGAERLAPFGKTIDDAIDHYVKYLEATERSCSVAEAVEGFISDKAQDGKGDRYLIELRSRLGRFVADFGNRVVAEIEAVQVDDWLRGLRVAPLTRNNYRRVLGTFFSYCLVRRYCAENPVLQTAKAKVKSKPIAVLTPEETERLLAAASPEIVPMIAIGAFAGLRPAEVSRLDWKEIRLERGYIEVTAAKSKTASRRLVKILPNLAAWLKPHAKPAGSVEPANARKLIDAARIRAGFEEWPSNALRHSFASYFLAKFQDAAVLALQMGHTTTGMIFAHYREVVTPEDADAYWRIAPKG